MMRKCGGFTAARGGGGCHRGALIYAADAPVLLKHFRTPH